MRFWMILSILVLASCTKKEPEPSVAVAEIQAPAPSEAADGESAAGGEDSEKAPSNDWGEPGLILLKPGKAPLQRLRRTFERGATAKIELSTKASTNGTPGWDARCVLALGTTEVSDDGKKASVALLVEEATPGPGGTSDSAMETLQKLKGLRGRYSIDSLGTIGDMEIQAPADADPVTLGTIDNMEETLRTMLSIPLPEAEVGVGAQWSLIEALEDGSGSMAQRTVYDLARIDGSKLHVRVAIEQASKGDAPAGPMKLLGLKGSGTGLANIELEALAPSDATQSTSRQVRFAQPGSDRVFALSLSFSNELSAK